MTHPFEKRNSSGDRNSILKGNFGKGINTSPDSATGASIKPANEKKTMTERERLQASLKATLTEFKNKSALKENRNGQAAQGGQKNH